VRVTITTQRPADIENICAEMDDLETDIIMMADEVCQLFRDERSP